MNGETNPKETPRFGWGGADTARVIAPPPLIFLAGLTAGLGLDWLWPWPLLPDLPQYIVGGALAGVGVVMLLNCFGRFRRAETALRPDKVTTALVTDGIYGRSRNPIYLAMALLYLGIMVAADALWLLATFIPVLTVMNTLVIAREERYLLHKFGEPYRQYMARVRRWI